MSKQIALLIKICIFFLLFCKIIFASEISIIPLKKPVLTEEIKKIKISKNIIKPLKKPVLKKNAKIDVTKKSKIKPLDKPKKVKKETIIKKKTKQIY
jgi:soluble lytic murein transglycosylase